MSNISNTILAPILSEGEPPVFDLTEGSGPIIVIGPHNGYYVPKSLYDQSDNPLGVDPSWFDPDSADKRHEACDWGMKELFTSLEGFFSETNCSVLSANQSRLVCDVNRSPDNWLTLKSDELDVPIPLNTSITPTEFTLRREELYNPWFTAIKGLTDKAKKAHGFAIILDLHSFTPTWNGQDRGLDIGSLRLEKTEISKLLTNNFNRCCKEHGLTHEPDAPYSLRTDPGLQRVLGGGTLAQNCDIHSYYGLEFRNDMLQDPEKRQVIVDIFKEAMTNLLEHPNLQEIAGTTYTGKRENHFHLHHLSNA